MYGPFHRLSNFPCLPLSFLLESHFSTLSPMLKPFALVLLSNIFLIFSCNHCVLMYTPSLVYCTWIIWIILLFISLSSDCNSWMSFITSTPKLVGKTASTPYTSWYGDIPIYFLFVNMSVHSACTNFLCHDFLFSSNKFLMMFTKLLFEDSTNPLPWG